MRLQGVDINRIIVDSGNADMIVISKALALYEVPAADIETPY